MAWFYLILAGIGEVIGVASMSMLLKKKRKRFIVLLTVSLIFSFSFLTLAMKSLSVGLSYAVWTGIGTVGGTIVGMLFFGESKNWKRLLFIGMILFAVTGLKLTTS